MSPRLAVPTGTTASLAAVAIAAALLCAVGAPAHAGTTMAFTGTTAVELVPDPVPGDEPGQGSDRVTVDPADAAVAPDRVPLVEVPPGCLAPELPDIVFVGTVVDRDFRTARFLIEQVRAGSEAGLAVDGIIDVRYGLDAQYLELDGEYLVSAQRDPLIGVLWSRVREPAPEFGGDDIVGIDQSDVQCPEIEDPIRTLQVDGTAVPASVLTPLFDSRSRLLGAVLLPVAVAVGLIFVLATLRLGVSGTIRGLRSVARRRRRR